MQRALARRGAHPLPPALHLQLSCEGDGACAPHLPFAHKLGVQSRSVPLLADAPCMPPLMPPSLAMSPSCAPPPGCIPSQLYAPPMCPHSQLCALYAHPTPGCIPLVCEAPHLQGGGHALGSWPHSSGTTSPALCLHIDGGGEGGGA